MSLGIFEAEHLRSILIHSSIAASARTTLLWTDARRAVDFLISNLSLIVENKYSQKDFAEILVEIGIGNSKAIQALSQLLLRNPDEETKRIWLWCLGEIGIGDANALSALAQLFHQTYDKTTCLEIAESIIKVDPNNKYAIAAFLTQVPRSNNHTYKALILERAGVQNRIIVEIIIKKLDDTIDDCDSLKLADFLSLINPKESLPYLQELLASQNETIRFEAACTLQKISSNNPQAIQTLNNLLTCENNFLVYSAAMMLQDINPGSRKVQDTFIELLNSKDDNIVLLTAREWRKIKVNTAELVNILLEIVRSSKNKADQEDAACTLLEVARDNQNVTSAAQQK